MQTQPKLSHSYTTAANNLQHARAGLLKGFLKGQEKNYLQRHARVMDAYFQESYEQSLVGPQMEIIRNPYAIVALGGYGRAEQCLHSDIDLLILFEKKVPRQAEELIREMVYPLWDHGLQVGHATRSLKECLSLASKDIEVLTALLDARFICGMSRLYAKLADQVRNKLLRTRANKIIRTLIDNNFERHARLGDSTYLLEPHLKEGQGGLRDYHTMLWIARIKWGIKQARDLEYHGILSHQEFQSLWTSLDFIWFVRNHLHDLALRKLDRLHFEHQEQLAARLNYQKTDDGQQPVELFLGELHAHMEYVKQQHLMFLYEQGYATSRKKPRKPSKQTNVAGLEIQRGRLQFANPEAVVKSPQLLIKIFEESARLKAPLSSEANRLVKEFNYLVDKPFRTAPQIVKSFERILVSPAPTFNVLNEMLRTGFLVRFIPPFRQITDRIQYDEYHIHPVDKHLLRTVQAIKRFGAADDPTNEPLCGHLLKDLRNRKLLYWAALLHDIGKGESGGGHSEKGAQLAKSILMEKGYAPDDIDTVVFLVRHHLLLVKTASRRDIFDEETAINCARLIKRTDRLKMLYLLTVADSISTGPKAWNDWTAALLRSFFLRILSTIERGELASDEAMAINQAKQQAVVAAADALPEGMDADTLFNFMSPRYLLYTPADDIPAHIRLFSRLGTNRFVWDVAPGPEENTRTVTICAQDAPGLFSRFAGTFTLNGVNILDAQVYTWRNNVVLDIFTVTPPPDQLFENERWERAAKTLDQVLSGELVLTEALKDKLANHKSFLPQTGRRPNRIVVDNESSSFFTIIEVFTHDFPGLLYSLTDALFRCKLDVWVSKIATKIDQVVDVFYVRDFDGQKVDSPEQEAQIKAALADVLPEGMETPTKSAQRESQ